MNFPPLLPSFRAVSTEWIRIQELMLPPDFAVPPHQHAPPHILVLLSGSLTERSDAGASLCRPRTIRYSPGGDTHRDIEIGRDGAHCLVLEARGFPELGLTERTTVDRTETADIVDALEHCLFAAESASPAVVEIHALELFSFMRARERSAHVQHHEWIASVRRYVDELHDMRSPLADAAAFIGRNASVVARTFRATYGITIQRHCRRRQLDHVWSMLGTTDLPLSEVALRGGFADQSHMSRVCARELECAPSALRASLQSGAQDARHWFRAAPRIIPTA